MKTVQCDQSRQFQLILNKICIFSHPCKWVMSVIPHQQISVCPGSSISAHTSGAVLCPQGELANPIIAASGWILSVIVHILLQYLCYEGNSIPPINRSICSFLSIYWEAAFLINSPQQMLQDSGKFLGREIIPPRGKCIYNWCGKKLSDRHGFSNHFVNMVSSNFSTTSEASRSLYLWVENCMQLEKSPWTRSCGLAQSSKLNNCYRKSLPGVYQTPHFFKVYF